MIGQARPLSFVLVLFGVSSGAGLCGQAVPTLRTSTQLVVVDVTVQDAKGRPVKDLTRGDFLVTEQGAAQTLRNFDEHEPAPEEPPKPAVPAKLPPGTYTDYTPDPPAGTLNVFLLDSLNTAVKDQSYALTQIADFLRKSPPGTEIAIFGLSSRLYLLKGFTTDTRDLQQIVKHSLRPGTSLLLDDPSGSNNNPQTTSELTSDATAPGPNPSDTDLLVSTMQQFEADGQAFQTQLRIQYTLDAFNALARYLQHYPGRKNIFWFSASFPINLLPNPAVPNSFEAAQNNAEEFHATSALLTRAQVAVFPIDSRGLQAPTLYDSARAGRGPSKTPNALANELGRYYTTQAVEHQTMDAIAADTGGHAFYNTNGIAEAISRGLSDGSSYYSLTYSPADHRDDGGYRAIHVELAGALAARGYHLTYRHGYYAQPSAAPTPNPAGTASSSGNADPGGASFARLAISHGAPTPSDLLFKVSVLPVSAGTQATVSPGNELSVANRPAGPFRAYTVEFAAPSREFSLTTQPDGRTTGAIQFSAFVFDAEGRLLNNAGSSIQLNLTAASRQSFLSDAVRFHLEISIPAAGETFLRLAVHDLPSNRFGVVELSTKDLSRTPAP